MITEMVKAHLENVKSLIIDLENQKNNIDKEIIKLKEYLAKGISELQNFESSTISNNAVENSSNVNVSNKYFLGD